MAFIVEDGTGLATATSYLSVADADTYHVDRGADAWTSAGADAKQRALVKATDYMDQKYGGRYIGARSTSEQALDWPRTEAYDTRGVTYTLVPKPVQDGCAEFALRALANELTPDPTYDLGGSVKALRVKVGDLEEETIYNGPTRGPVFTSAVNVLRRVLVAGNRSVR